MANALKKIEETNKLPAYLEEDQTGEGLSHSADDLLRPMARVLQPMSPEVEKKGSSYVPGAEPGKILIKNTPLAPIDGDTGFVFQHCQSTSAVVEWVPRMKGGGGGQGFVASHPVKTASEVPGAKQTEDPLNPGRKIWVNGATGNWLVETRYVAGLLYQDGQSFPIGIPFSSTGHTVFKAFQTLMSYQTNSKGQQLNSYAGLYRVKTKLRTKGSQSWYVLEFSNDGPNGAFRAATPEEYQRGKAFAEALKKMTIDHSAVAETSTDDDSM